MPAPRAADKQDVNLAICGHAWHGKSTLVGKTACELGMISRRELQQYEDLASKGRDASLVFALLVFRQKDVTEKTGEAARGITVLPSFVRFEFPKHRVTVIDTPGQEAYANNRFSGMFSADVACLVVDVTDGVQPVTEQVLRVLRGYEIPLRAVALTKMDRVGFEQAAYDKTVAEVRAAIKKNELSDEGVDFIPLSAYETGRSIFEPGEGITKVTRMPWYKGPTFHKFMGGLDLRQLRPASPLRVVIHSADIHEQVPGIGTAFTGLVESGAVKRDAELVFQPVSDEQGGQVTAHVRSIELTRGHLATPGIPLQEAHPRQLIGCALRQVSTRESLRELFKNRGVVAGTKDSVPAVAHEFEAEVTVFEPDTRVAPGHHWTLHCHVDKVGCEILSIAHPAGAHRTEDKWDLLQPGEWVTLRIAPVRPIAIEEAGKLAPLSKIVLRQDNRPIGIGRCIRIIR
ncbi:MAG TPA: GTP-binding protein [Planctomycetota bacterium]|nr:GTP-binding protein [Planctomycetota bacterium]